METNSANLNLVSAYNVVGSALLAGFLALAGCDGDDTSTAEDESASSLDVAPFTLVDTAQVECYDADGATIVCPAAGEAFFGQDAQNVGLPPDLAVNADGTVTDHVTGLVWEQTPADEGLSRPEALAYCDELELGAATDWRLPSTKELFSISNFS